MVSGLKSRFDKKGIDGVLVFRDDTGAEVDFDLTGSLEDALERVMPKPEHQGRGRPKLGVVSREISSATTLGVARRATATATPPRSAGSSTRRARRSPIARTFARRRARPAA